MKNISGIIITLLFVSGQALAQGDNKELAYWQDTNLSYKILEERYLNDKNCRLSEQNFLGCIDALELLSKKQGGDEPLTFLSLNHRVAKEDIVATFGNLVVAKDRQWMTLQAEKLKGLPAYKARKAYTAATDKVWLTLFKNSGLLTLGFTQALRHLTHKLDAKAEKLLTAYAINEYLASAKDPHTYIQPSAKFVEEAASSDENFVGVGVTLEGAGEVDGQLLIREVIEEGPAHKAGLQAKDKIIAIDGKNVLGMSADELVTMVRGPEGSIVSLTILRGTQTLKIEVVRAPVVIENLRAKVITTPSGEKLGYIRLKVFLGQNVCEDFTKNLIIFQSDSAIKGVVVDLRNNGGGSLDIVGCMLDAFLPAGETVISLQDPDTNKLLEIQKTYDKSVLFTKSLVVLTNGYSASASEIFAGGVQDHKLGYVVGARTYGKGTVQSVMLDFTLEGVARAETIGRFHLPSGRTNQIVGVEPDFEAYNIPNPTEEEKFAEREEDRYRRVIKATNTQRTVYLERLADTRACVQAGGLNQKTYADGNDFSMLVAADVIVCDRSLALNSNVSMR